MMNEALQNTGYETVTATYGNNTIEYKIVKGTAYHIQTPDKVVSILNNVLASFRVRRIRLFFGDANTGRDWCEEYDIIGTVGRSTGKIKVPLLIKTANSSGGGAILDHCIVKITEDKYTLYEHPNYHIGELKVKTAPISIRKDGYTHSVYRDGKMQANFKSKTKADNYVAFLKGERNRL